jgi:hypothetical protein
MSSTLQLKIYLLTYELGPGDGEAQADTALSLSSNSPSKKCRSRAQRYFTQRPNRARGRHTRFASKLKWTMASWWGRQRLAPGSYTDFAASTLVYYSNSKTGGWHIGALRKDMSVVEPVTWPNDQSSLIIDVAQGTTRAPPVGTMEGLVGAEA